MIEERPTFVGTVPAEIRSELAADLTTVTPQFRVVAGETSVTVQTRPSKAATWSEPVVARRMPPLSDQTELFHDQPVEVKAERTFAYGATPVQRPAVYVHLSPDDLALAAEIAQRRQSRSEEVGRPNRRVAKMSDLALNRLGARAEVAVARHYGAALPRVDLGPLRDGTLGDVGGVEVKSTTREHGRLLLWTPRHDAKDRPVVLVIDEGPRFRIAGWIWTHEARAAEFLGRVPAASVLGGPAAAVARSRQFADRALVKTPLPPPPMSRRLYYFLMVLGSLLVAASLYADELP